MRNSFVWDDTALVLRDPLIRHWRLVPESFQEFLFLDATASDFYRPIQRLTFTADYALWGINRADSTRTNAPDTGDSADTRAVLAAAQPGWHFTSVLIHALAAVALYFLLNTWLKNGRILATAAATLWAVHPLHTSAVTYVSGRADPLAALFIFTALALLAHSHAGGGLKKGDRPAAWKVIGAALCCLLALLSKEAGVAGLTLWLIWLLGKARTSPRSWAAFAATAILVATAYFTLRLSADRTPPPHSSTTTTLVERAGLMTRALAEYTKLFIAPHNLHMERDITPKPATQAIAGTLILAAFAAWAHWARRRAPDTALALACAAAAWLPVSNLFTLNSTMAEHWLYVPSAFLIAALAFTAQALPRRPLAAIAAIATIWLTFLATQTWLQQTYWKDQTTFLNTTIERAGRGKRMLANLASLELEAGHQAQGEALLQEALALDPTSAGLHLMKAGIALSKSDTAAAQAAAANAQNDPFFTSELLLLRSSIQMLKDGKPNIKSLATAAASSPRNWSIVRAHPLALEYLGQPDEAYKALLLTNFTRNYRAESWRTIARMAEKLNNPAIAQKAYGEAANRDTRDTYSRDRIRLLSGAQ